VRFRPGLATAPLKHLKFLGGRNVENQSGATTEHNLVVSAFRAGIPVADIARRIGKKPGSVVWVLKKAGLKANDRTQSVDSDGKHSGGVDPAKSSRRGDLAFQRAMRRAIALGLEHPPMIGVFKDPRPLNAPQVFEPVPHSSGCASPAQECAELESEDD
jgi:hypothetical protein